MRSVDSRARFQPSRSVCRRIVATLVVSAGLVFSSAGSARADLVIIQDSNGFPGGGQVEEARQRVFLGEDRLRVLDEQHGWALYVLRDKKLVREASVGDRTFVEKPFSDYQKIRQEREATRTGKVAEYQKEREKAKTDAARVDLKKTIEGMGLREDGKTLARTEHFNEWRNVSVIVGGVRKELKAEHVIVRENEGPPVFDLWTVPEMARPEGLYRFYNEIGTFSEPVIAEVMKLPGFPVEISATIDDGNNHKTLHSKVIEIRDQVTAPADYEIPAGWKQVQPQQTALAPAVATKCAVCGKSIVPGSDDGSTLWRNPFDGRPYPVCSDEHRREMIKRVARGDSPASSPAPPQPPK